MTRRIDPSPLTWDGGNPDFYLADFAGPNADFRVMSPQVEAMNWPFMLAEARRLNPSFWFEFSSWSGGAGMQAYFASLGQSFTPERYGAMVRFGLWLMRPRLVREYPFSNSRGPTSVDEPRFRPGIDAVDAVHANPVQRRFWQDSALVAVRSRQHPYQSAIPAEYASADRMVLLPTDLDPAAPWTIDTALPVLALARVAGASPRREWLVYAQAPTGDRRGVTLTIPDYGAVCIDVPVGGALWLVREADGAVLPVGDGPTGSG